MLYWPQGKKSGCGLSLSLLLNQNLNICFFFPISYPKAVWIIEAISRAIFLMPRNNFQLFGVVYACYEHSQKDYSVFSPVTKHHFLKGKLVELVSHQSSVAPQIEYLRSPFLFQTDLWTIFIILKNTSEPQQQISI